MATVAGAKVLIDLIILILELVTRMTSAKMPEAVTSAPAPAPLITSGCSGYLSYKTTQYYLYPPIDKKDASLLFEIILLLIFDFQKLPRILTYTN